MRRVLPAIVLVALVACGAPRTRKISRAFYVDDVPPGHPSAHLYWLNDGKWIVVDREIDAYADSGCLMYETSRPGVARALYAVLPGKTPIAIAASDTFRPWRLAYDGARRFDMPRTDVNGVTMLGFDFVQQPRICGAAFQQPAFHEDWAKKDPADFTRTAIEHVDLDVNGADSVGNSTLAGAIYDSKEDVIAELIRAGADVNSANVAGVSPLMSTTGYYREGPRLLRMLLDAHATVDARDNRGMTALMYAAQRDNVDAVKLLLERGADARLRDSEGRTAAAMTGNSEKSKQLTALLERAAAGK